MKPSGSIPINEAVERDAAGLEERREMAELEYVAKGFLARLIVAGETNLSLDKFNEREQELIASTINEEVPPKGESG